ncbi:hypothetical protein [Microcoleus sp. B4-D4]|uniref:hypothetical protein n=1 Tax=Microcoleus sp. B4-D4 TaxID=2818667 RepID=UPI002FCF40AE
MKSAIRNENLCATIEVDAAVPLLRVNGLTYDCCDIREAELFYNIIECHPKILTYDQIIERILKKYGIADDLYSDPIHYIRKKKLGLCKLLSETTGFQQEEIIINVRKVGYRLKTGWERVYSFSSDILQDNAAEVQKKTNEVLSRLDLLLAEISSLKSIIEETIDLSKRLELSRISNVQEDLTLVLNHEGHEQAIAALAERFTSMGRKLFTLLEINPFDSRHIRIMRIIETIFSYVTMSRQGTNISEATWRMLFDRELISHYESLVAECILPHL